MLMESTYQTHVMVRKSDACGLSQFAVEYTALVHGCFPGTGGDVIVS